MFMKDISKIERIGNIYGFTGGSFAGMVYGVNGCAPALNTMGGGRREPLILEFQSTQHGDGTGFAVAVKNFEI